MSVTTWKDKLWGAVIIFALVGVASMALHSAYMLGQIDAKIECLERVKPR